MFFSKCASSDLFHSITFSSCDSVLPSAPVTLWCQPQKPYPFTVHPSHHLPLCGQLPNLQLQPVSFSTPTYNTQSIYGSFNFSSDHVKNPWNCPQSRQEGGKKMEAVSSQGFYCFDWEEAGSFLKHCPNFAFPRQHPLLWKWLISLFSSIALRKFLSFSFLSLTHCTQKGICVLFCFALCINYHSIITFNRKWLVYI